MFHFILVVSIMTMAQQSLAGSLIDIKTEQEYRDRVASGHPLVIELYADWCGVCIRVKDILDQLASSPELSHVTFARINIDELAQLPGELDVTGIPTFLYIIDGKVVAKETGIAHFDQIKEHIRTKSIELFSAAAVPQETIIVPEEKPAQKSVATTPASETTDTKQSQQIGHTQTIWHAFTAFLAALFDAAKAALDYVILKIKNLF